MGAIEDRLKTLGITLPKPAAAAGNYVPVLDADGWIYVSGQLPMVEGKVASTGKVGADVSLEDAYAAARTCAINALALLYEINGGHEGALENLQIVRVGGFVASAPGFTDQPKVINGASDLLGQVLGENGRHARAAVGVAELPLGASVEVELVAKRLGAHA